MSGTSLDGVDAALVRIDGPETVRLEQFVNQPFAPADRTAILEAITRGSVRELALLHVELGHRFADAAQALLARSGTAPGAVRLVASHGQTVWHEPGRATLQLGDAAVIAERLGTVVVSDFRSRDVAAGGQGAPLVPIADVMLFGDARHGRVLLNLGGVANLTWVPRRGQSRGALAFDTGPGVAVIDHVVRAIDPEVVFDRDGTRAARGRVVEEVVEAALAHPYFAEPPPKSTGRETFGEAFADRFADDVRAHPSEPGDDDVVATAVALTARAVADQIRRWVRADDARELLLSGGGARNPVLREMLEAVLPGWCVRRFEDEFFDGDAKEAVAFAYLGWRTLEGLPGNLPAVTGAAGSRILGKVEGGLW